MGEAKHLRMTANKLGLENERLIIKLNAEHIARQNVESKNAKLRELIADMWNDAVTRMDFADRHEFIDKFGNRMHELEVEV